MSKKTSPITRRPWRLLRLALQGGLFKNRISVSFNILHKVIRKLVHSHESRRALAYGDHEFSFDDTPMVHVKMHRPASALRFHIPCIRPQVDFDYEEGDDMSLDEAMWSFHAQSTCTLEDEDCDEGIDVRAEEFIAKFYEQMKLQRQISYLEYS